MVLLPPTAAANAADVAGGSAAAAEVTPGWLLLTMAQIKAKDNCKGLCEFSVITKMLMPNCGPQGNGCICIVPS